MLETLWLLAWLVGWVVWLLLLWWTIRQTRMFVAEGPSVLRRVNAVRTIASAWLVLLGGLFAGVGRIHLIWISQLIMYMPPILSALSLRWGGAPHGVIAYLIVFMALISVAGMGAPELAEMVGLHLAIYHVVVLVCGLIVALAFRRRFLKNVAFAEES